MTRLLPALTLSCVPLLACTGDASQSVDPGAEADDVADDTDAVVEETPRSEYDELLELREVDYSHALRKASLRLVGDLPTLAEIEVVAQADDPATAYRGIVEAYLEDERFAGQIGAFWRDTFKMGGTAILDSAPLFATRLTLEDQSLANLLTAPAGTCPTVGEGGEIVPADCDNGVETHAGLLTHPGVMSHYYSNMAFRRVRWVQETFACTAFPAEVTEPKDVGGASPYTAPWPFESIAGTTNGGSIDFLDTSAVTCANCHATMNHLAPLFGNFDAAGNWSDAVAVTNPTDGSPTTLLSDWLPEGEATAWRQGVFAADLSELGAVMVADPRVAECMVARAWNWALGKGDIVDALSAVPTEVIQAQIALYDDSGQTLRPLLLSVFTSDDFVRF